MCDNHMGLHQLMLRWGTQGSWFEAGLLEGDDAVAQPFPFNDSWYSQWVQVLLLGSGEMVSNAGRIDFAVRFPEDLRSFSPTLHNNLFFLPEWLDWREWKAKIHIILECTYLSRLNFGCIISHSILVI
jgi:hypothetical protein